MGRTSMLPVRTDGNLLSDLEGVVQIPGLDQVVAAQLLLRLGERSVGGGQLAVPRPHGRRRLHRLKRVAAQVVAAAS